MPNYAVYQVSNNRVKEYVISSPFDPTYPAGVGFAAIREPDVTGLVGVPVLYWKHSGGFIVEMTALEKSTLDAEIVAQALDDMQEGGKSVLSAATPSGIILRAVADITKDEINLLRQWLASFKVQVAASTNLANLQTRVAALPDMPDRTLAQLRTAIQNRIDSDQVNT